MTREPLNEERLRNAFQAEVAGVEPAGDNSLDVIRRRGRAAIARRRAVVGALGAVLVAGGVFTGVAVLGGDEGQTVIVDPGPEETTSTSEPPPTTPSTPATATTTPAPAVEQPFLWPPVGHEQYTDPVAAARSFVTEYVGFRDPQLGEVREAEPRLLEVDVLALGEDGQPFDGRLWSTLQVAQVADGTWRVRLATSDEVVIEAVEATADEVTVTGRGNGFEGTLNGYAVDADGGRLGEPSIITVECCSGPQPFESTIPVPERPASVLVISSTGIDRGSSFAAVPVDSAGTTVTVDSAGTTVTVDSAGTTVTVFFVDAGGAVEGSQRRVTPPAVLNGALAALLAGPSEAEQASGVTTALPAGLTATAALAEGEATVDLTVPVGQTLPPDQAALAIEQLTRTVFQFPSVSAVTFEVGGSCADFASWAGRGGDCRFERS